MDPKIQCAREGGREGRGMLTAFGVGCSRAGVASIDRAVCCTRPRWAPQSGVLQLCCLPFGFHHSLLQLVLLVRSSGEQGHRMRRGHCQLGWMDRAVGRWREGVPHASPTLPNTNVPWERKEKRFTRSGWDSDCTNGTISSTLETPSTNRAFLSNSIRQNTIATPQPCKLVRFDIFEFSL